MIVLINKRFYLVLVVEYFLTFLQIREIPKKYYDKISIYFLVHILVVYLELKLIEFVHLPSLDEANVVHQIYFHLTKKKQVLKFY